MDDKMKAMLQTLESALPPEGLKARMMDGLLYGSVVELSRLQRLVFACPLRAAGIIAVTVSGLLWAILGKDYPALLTSLFSGR